jgi:hypothetical protein
MSLKLKLKMLSRKMKIIGNMHPDYKGIGMHSRMSNCIIKGMLYYYLKYYKTELSIIYIDHYNDKITWYNKSLFITNNRVLVCVDDKCMCVRMINNTILVQNTFLKLKHMESMNTKILQMLIDYNIFDIDSDDIRYDDETPIQNTNNEKDNSVCMALLNYIYTDDEYSNIHKGEVLRLTLGEYIYSHLIRENIRPMDLATEFDNYIEKYERIVYVMC